MGWWIRTSWRTVRRWTLCFVANGHYPRTGRRAAEIHALVEYAHPFVVGNIPTGREFLADVISVGPYSLDVEGMGWPGWCCASYHQ